MAKEILLYGGIFNFSAELFINQLEEFKDDDIVLRINSDGGEPASGFGMIKKFQEHPGDKRIKVDGKANSMAAFYLCYVKDAEALDVSEFVLHRAAFAAWFESSESLFTEGDKERLIKVNKDLRKALESKIDVPKFEKITGVTLDELFNMETRISANLTAGQARQVGLINRVIPITPAKKASIESNMSMIAAQHTGVKSAPETNTPTKTMDLTKLKAEHPELYAEVFGLGQAKGKEDETERINAWMEFSEIDMKAVKEGISKDESISASHIQAFSKKAINASKLENLEEESEEELETGDGKRNLATVTATVEEKAKAEEMTKFEADVKNGLNLKENE